MDFTTSYESNFPADVAARYEIVEVRNASAILKGAAPDEFDSLVGVLREFRLTDDMLLEPGGSEGPIAKELNRLFRDDGWREAGADLTTQLVLRLSPYGPDEGGIKEDVSSKDRKKGYKVDNFRGRVAIDIEWNAKDGNLDRDISAYRSFYDLALIDAAVIITRTHEDLRKYVQTLARARGFPEAEASKLLSTSTTTNLSKLRPKLARGDSGGCPVLAIAICPATVS